MTTRNYSDPDRRETTSPWAVGIMFFAGAILSITGIFQVLEGIVALADDNFYVKTSHYPFDISSTGWGLAHLIIGTIVTLVGIGILYGQNWARALGIVGAMLSIFANFLFIPHYPLWTIVIIAFDLVVIWALSQPMSN